jgi:hypothetical protein
MSKTFGMERRALIAFVASMALFLLYDSLYLAPKMREQRARERRRSAKRRNGAPQKGKLSDGRRHAGRVDRAAGAGTRVAGRYVGVVVACRHRQRISPEDRRRFAAAEIKSIRGRGGRRRTCLFCRSAGR